MSRAYINGDYVDVEDVEALELPVDEQIFALKEELKSYYYISDEITMGIATREEYAEEIERAKELKKKIRELEETL